MRYWKGVSLLAAFIFTAPIAAHADGRMQMLVQSGDWSAAEHFSSDTGSPDVCMAANLQAGVLLRADDTGDLEFRMMNESWSLPSDVTGDIKVAVNGNKYTYHIAGNTVNSVSAELTEASLNLLSGDMEEANSMTVTPGKGAPLTVSLNGSKQAITAFLTCAGLPSPSSDTGGSNPFSSSN